MGWRYLGFQRARRRDRRSAETEPPPSPSLGRRGCSRFSRRSRRSSTSRSNRGPGEFPAVAVQPPFDAAPIGPINTMVNTTFHERAAVLNAPDAVAISLASCGSACQMEAPRRYRRQGSSICVSRTSRSRRPVVSRPSGSCTFYRRLKTCRRVPVDSTHDPARRTPGYQMQNRAADCRQQIERQ